MWETGQWSFCACLATYSFGECGKKNVDIKYTIHSDNYGDNIVCIYIYIYTQVPSTGTVVKAIVCVATCFFDFEVLATDSKQSVMSVQSDGGWFICKIFSFSEVVPWPHSMPPDCCQHLCLRRAFFPPSSIKRITWSCQLDQQTASCITYHARLKQTIGATLAAHLSRSDLSSNISSHSPPQPISDANIYQRKYLSCHIWIKESISRTIWNNDSWTTKDCNWLKILDRHNSQLRMELTVTNTNLI